MHNTKNTKLPFAALILAALLTAALSTSGLLSTSQLVLSLTLLGIGTLLGATLNYFHFGFSSSFRALIGERKTAGMRAIIIMLGLSILLFAPLLYSPGELGNTHTGFIRPISSSILIGAFIFGIGMQISCGCTSGTLNRVGQMQALALPTLLFMIVGGTFAAASFDDWRSLPALEPFAFQNHLSWPLALLSQITLLSILYFLFIRYEKSKHGKIEPLLQSRGFRHPFLLAGIGLAALNALLFWVNGSPWSISSVFPYWGIHSIELLSLPVDWQFWDYAMENQNHLGSRWYENPINLTTLGVVIGAFIISLFNPREKVPFSFFALFISMVGGLIMGFGAVLASGCNIGAFFSGIASGSLHGWVWFVFALLGNLIGLELRKRLIVRARA